MSLSQAEYRLVVCLWHMLLMIHLAREQYNITCGPLGCELTSGVPQRSVLGPCLFLYYINDIAQGLTSTVRLFADDTIIYMAIKSDQDAKTLQKDMDLLCDWENKWMMEFDPDKCEILSITRKKQPRVYPYQLHGHHLN